MAQNTDIIDIGYFKNTPHKNTDKWRPAACHFEEFGCYTNLPPNDHPSSRFYKFWEEEARRSVYGFKQDDGDWIPGYFYFYLNYCPIYIDVEINDLNEPQTEEEQLARLFESAQAEEKEVLAPYWDGDYQAFHYYDDSEKSGEDSVVLKTRRRGYSEPNSELVLTPDGFREMGSLKIGDYVIGSDGNPTKILEIFPQGKIDVYEVEFHDNRKVRCSRNHLWGVYNTKRDYSVVTTEYLINNKLKQHENTNKSSYSYKIPSIKPVRFNKKEYEIDPYLLGLLIGDGNINGSQIRFSTIDYELLFYISFILGSDYNFKKSKNDYYFSFTSKKRGYNKLIRDIKKLNLNVKSYQKFIPEKYKYGSIEQRFELVKGLMDTDGTVSKSGNCRFISSSEKLVDDLLEVLRSLGIRCRKAKTNLGGKLTDFGNGHKSITRDSWIISITSYDQIFKLTRKAKKLDNAIKNRKLKRQDTIGIKSIKKLDYQEESTCILIDNKNHLYLTTDYIPTHNSYKGASMCLRNYYMLPGSKSYVFASDKEFLIGDGILTKAWNMMDHIEQHTPWGKRRQQHNAMFHRRASYWEHRNGLKIEKGFKSEIIGISLKNDWGKARGKKGKLILYEEAGKFPHLLYAWNVTQKSMRQGRLTHGLQIAFGTGGTEGEDILGLDQLFYDGKTWGIHTIPNKWDKGLIGTPSGHFVSVAQNLEGTYDKDGNSNYLLANKLIDNSREKIRINSKNPERLTRFVAEEPRNPQEALMRIGGGMFPVNDIKEQIAHLRSHPEIYEETEYIGQLTIDSETGKIKWKPDDTLRPIRKYPEVDKDNKEGCIIIYEQPVTDVNGEIPYGLYIAGNDCYDHDDSSTESLGSTFIMNRLTKRIVAEYTGRPATAPMYYENARRLLLYYNAICNYENNLLGIKTYFDNHQTGYLMCDTPRAVVDKIYEKAVLSREKGTPGTEPIKKWGRELALAWLLEPISPGNNLLNLHKVRSIPLLQELMYWNKSGNFDRVDALGYMLMLDWDLQHMEIDMNKTSKPTVPEFFARMEMFQEKIRQQQLEDPFSKITSVNEEAERRKMDIMYRTNLQN